MIILGLGTNVGDRMQNLRQALSAIKNIAGLQVLRVSPIYHSDAMLPENAPDSWNLPFLNCAVACVFNGAPEQLLTHLQSIETQLGRLNNHAHWSPRVIDIDILIWDDRVIQSKRLNVPHPHLHERPFALWPLADLAPLWLHPQKKLTAEQLALPLGSRYLGDAPFHTQQINQRIDTPVLMAAINITPDSFSDGGNFYAPEKAFAQAKLAIDSGAEVLDLGAEATSPAVTPIDANTEWQRLEPVLAAIMQAKKDFLLPPLISVDTRHAEVAEHALAYGIDWMNDVTGFQDPRMRAVAREAKTDCVIMHHLSIPPTRENVLPQDQDPVELLIQWGRDLLALLEKDGIALDRVILDPGIGFGKTAAQSLALLQGLPRLKALQTRWLIGHARKSFMSALTPHTASERDLETLVIAEYLNRQQVDYLRVHNVEYCARAFRIQQIFAEAVQPPHKMNQTLQCDHQV